MNIEQDPSGKFRCQLKDGTWIESDNERALRFIACIRNKEIESESKEKGEK